MEVETNSAIVASYAVPPLSKQKSMLSELLLQEANAAAQHAAAEEDMESASDSEDGEDYDDDVEQSEASSDSEENMAVEANATNEDACKCRSPGSRPIKIRRPSE